MKALKLVIDIGNSNIKLAFFNPKVNDLDNYFISNNNHKTISYITKIISKIDPDIVEIIIGSTNQKKSITLLKLLKEKLKNRKSILNIHELKIENFNNNFGFEESDWKELGIDLFAIVFYFQNSLPCSIINFGTAISIITLNKKNPPKINLLPGLKISEDALRRKAEQIPLKNFISSTNKALFDGKLFFINSIFLNLLEINKKNHDYSLNISGGDYPIILMTLKQNFYYKFSNKKIDLFEKDYGEKKINIYLHKEITLHSYWKLWLTFYDKL